MTPELDAQIMKTIALLRSKKPQIYDPQTTFFKDEDIQAAQEKWEQKKKAKKEMAPSMTLKDFHRRELLAKVGPDGEYIANPEEEEEDIETPVQEQERIKKEVKAAFASALESDGEENDDELLTLRPKKAVIEDEPAAASLDGEEYKNFLLEHIGMEDNAAALAQWRSFKKSQSQEADTPSQTIDPDESFLMEYVLTKGWMDPEADDSANRIPSYNEIVDDSEDEANVEAMEAFETAYNFRFEAEQGAELVTHTRTIDGSMRRKDDKRKRMREKKLERKAEEKTKKDQELMRLKNLKKEEIRERLRKIQEVAGGTLPGLEEVDLEKDFEPSEFDSKMESTFGQSYYDQEDPLKKPVFDDDIDISDLVPAEETAEPEPEHQEEDGRKKKKKKKKKGSAAQEDQFFNMDADYFDGEDALPNSEEVPPPKDTSLEAYLEDLFQLDYEDIVADIPTRFKYRKVASDFKGLDPVEILKADDAALNDFVSLKKLAPYRQPEKVERDEKVWQKTRKKRLYTLRRALREEAEKAEKEAKEQEEELSHNSHKKAKKQKREKEQPVQMVDKGKTRLTKDRLKSYGVDE